MAKIVRFTAVTLITRQIIGFLPELVKGAVAWVSSPAWRVSQGARPEFKHAMLFFRCNGSLGFHCCQSRDMLILFSTLARSLKKIFRGLDALNYPSTVSWNLP
jgi:hypothetical protein